MRNNRKESSLLHRYVDDLYTVEDVNQLQDMLKENSKDQVLDELSEEIWEEAMLHNTDVDKERYKEEARILLKKIGGKKKLKIRKIWLTVTTIAAVLCLIWGSIEYFQLINGTRIDFQEVETS